MNKFFGENGNDYLSRGLRLANRLYRKEHDRLLYRKAARDYAKKGTTQLIDWDWDAILYNRVALLNTLAARNPNASYLEIGCFR
ncbi:hypothetical protein KHC23_23310 [Ancylobacter dichloromethanicus]|uniref:Uncharacterized protein n=1 Tax=Ancylobacter dichloromethanicus TaxID=518825 RepID=A0A9W6J853_9HYPH|nr:hypothetical protein [Ancylobacter dichloromethanicus]MBS7556560.1 hypothetical protein [Ancylobacter dichloromethanicus]GLK72512.1 hypothetical protein GCM10017643_26280 [Ancylobacter dichloromethanicus]